jgi:hypothetical protein
MTRTRVVVAAALVGITACSVAQAQTGSLMAGGPASDSASVYDRLADPVDLGLRYSWGRQDTGEGGGAQPEEEIEEGLFGGEIEAIDDTGTDPRDFRPKFMPYYRYTELGNDIEIQEFVLFGLIPFTPEFAMTFEFPVYKTIDYSDLDAFQRLEDFPPGQGTGIPSGGVPFDDLANDGDVSSIGDLNLRFFYKPKEWGGTYADGENTWTLFPVFETTLPTAQNDVIGGNNWLISPGFVWVTDLPGGPPFGLGFFAMMNFYDTNAWRDDGYEWTSRFRGRWFWMQPLSKPGPDPLDGLYMLTEFQPIYDFEGDDFDLWIGPELGKMMGEGSVMYAKPGWAIVDREENDREFTFEVGVRFFF